MNLTVMRCFIFMNTTVIRVFIKVNYDITVL